MGEVVDLLEWKALRDLKYSLTEMKNLFEDTGWADFIFIDEDGTQHTLGSFLNEIYDPPEK